MLRLALVAGLLAVLTPSILACGGGGTSYMGPSHSWNSDAKGAVGPERAEFVGTWRWIVGVDAELVLRPDLTFSYISQLKFKGPSREVTGTWDVVDDVLVVRVDAGPDEPTTVRHLDHWEPPEPLQTLVDRNGVLLQEQREATEQGDG